MDHAEIQESAMPEKHRAALHEIYNNFCSRYFAEINGGEEDAYQRINAAHKLVKQDLSEAFGVPDDFNEILMRSAKKAKQNLFDWMETGASGGSDKAGVMTPPILRGQEPEENDDREELEDSLVYFTQLVEERLSTLHSTKELLMEMEEVVDGIVLEAFVSPADPKVLDMLGTYLAEFRQQLGQELFAIAKYDEHKETFKKLLEIEQKVSLAKESLEITRQWALEDSDGKYPCFFHQVFNEKADATDGDTLPEHREELAHASMELLKSSAARRGVPPTPAFDPLMPLIIDRCRKIVGMHVAQTENTYAEGHKFRNKIRSAPKESDLPVDGHQQQQMVQQIVGAALAGSFYKPSEDEFIPIGAADARKIMDSIASLERSASCGLH